MSDELHRVSTKAFLKALGDRSLSKKVLALLRMHSPAPTLREMLEDYAYGWDEHGGAHSNTIGSIISYHNRTRPHEPILSVYGAGYFLPTPELNWMAVKGHQRNHWRLALKETAQ